MGISVVYGGVAPRISNLIVDADLVLGTYKLKFANSLLRDGNPGFLYLRNITDTSFIGLWVTDVKGNLSLSTNIINEYTANNGVTVDGFQIKDGVLGIPKTPSDNIREFNDTEVLHATIGIPWEEFSRITFTNGIKGTLRIKFSHKGACWAETETQVFKNGVGIGTIQRPTINNAYEEESEDIDVGTIAPGGFLSLYGRDQGTYNSNHYVKEFRCYHDNIDLNVTAFTTGEY